MNLEETDESETNDPFFCWSCGKQLFTIDEIAQQICHICKKDMNQTNEEKTFFCWACGEKLQEMSEVAQGLCNHCKASIIRKISTPQKK